MTPEEMIKSIDVDDGRMNEAGFLRVQIDTHRKIAHGREGNLMRCRERGHLLYVAATAAEKAIRDSVNGQGLNPFLLDRAAALLREAIAAVDDAEQVR